MCLLILPSFLLHKPGWLAAPGRLANVNIDRKVPCICARESAPLSPDNNLCWVLLGALIELTSMGSQTIGAKSEVKLKLEAWKVTFGERQQRVFELGGVWRTQENFREDWALQQSRAVELQGMNVQNRLFSWLLHSLLRMLKLYFCCIDFTSCYKLSYGTLKNNMLIHIFV